MKAFVTGGDGFIGGHLTRMLVQRGYQVSALTLSHESVAGLRNGGAEPVVGNLLDDAILREALAGHNTVFHTAGMLEFFDREQEMTRVNVDGTRALVEAARAAGVIRFVLISAAAVVSTGAPVIDADESRPIPPRPFGVYARTKMEGERIVLGANGGPFTAVAVRPPAVWGLGDNHFLPRLIAAIMRRQYVWIDGGKYRYSTCHVKNVCEAAVLAAERGRGGHAYFVCDSHPPSTFRDFVTGLLATLGISIRAMSLPRPLVWKLAAALEFGWRALHLRGAPPVTRAQLALMGGEFTVCDARARRELGYSAHVRCEEGLSELRNGRSQ